MVYLKAEAGQKAFRERSALFSARQRAAFILFDGVKSVDQVLAATTGFGVTALDIEHMVTQGCLVEVVTPGSSAGETSTPSKPVQAITTAAFPSAAAAAVATTTAAPAPMIASAAKAPPILQRTPQERYSRAKPLATQLTASLGLRGFLLNLGVESASGYDDLLALFPKIQSAVGAKKCAELERVLKA